MNRLEERIRQWIATYGALSVEAYMSMALSDPQDGYYMTRSPIGLQGDFITAPEISQMFGELLGVWAIESWALMQAPSPFRLVELGPGRGTLMKDVLRIAQKVPDFLKGVSVHLVEMSPVLMAQQQNTLAPLASLMDIRWHADMREIPPGPCIFLANEFFDALPIRQYVHLAKGWYERLVGLDAEDRLAFCLSGREETILAPPAPAGTLVEVNHMAIQFTQELAARLKREGGAALLIDYGYIAPQYGSTLQAVQGHAYAPFLENPGASDLTSLVNFHALSEAARRMGATCFGAISQGLFLRRMEIERRAEVLKRNANLRQKYEIELSLTRLTSADPVPELHLKFGCGMGELFKVLAICGQAGWIPPGFRVEEEA